MLASFSLSSVLSRRLTAALPCLLSLTVVHPALTSAALSQPAMTQPAMSQPVIIQGSIPRTLTVTGEGTQSLPTTLTQVQLGVEVQGQKADAVQQTAAQQTTRVVEFLKSRSVQRLETSGIRLQPNYEYQNNQRRTVGYIATNMVSFRIKTEEVGSLLDEAVRAGATRIDGINFIAEDSAIAAAQKEALRLATLDAQQQAEAVLKALNFTPQEIIGIEIGDARSPIPRPVPMMAASRGVADAVTPVIGGEQTVRATVTLQIRY